ncbi:SET domain-containing protein [Aspergillus ellipticus CBS 707.79]|uniref:SET domain-containing protein n=1 Tax=Aspergillus ellipticus CBS 707.79 TaxID=1448320 RepID=A0A319DEV4_9EURO|nr:SET domain-containing protein [Aspergillus ellipticus CBS 707.79]
MSLVTSLCPPPPLLGYYTRGPWMSNITSAMVIDLTLDSESEGQSQTPSEPHSQAQVKSEQTPSETHSRPRSQSKLQSQPRHSPRPSSSLESLPAAAAAAATAVRPQISSFTSPLAHHPVSASSVPAKRKSEDAESLLAAFRPHSQPRAESRAASQPDRIIPKKITTVSINENLRQRKKPTPNPQNIIVTRRRSLQLNTPSPGPGPRPIAPDVVIPSTSRHQRRAIASAESILADNGTPKGVNEKYYPIVLHETRAKNGLYPAQRDVVTRHGLSFGTKENDCPPMYSKASVPSQLQRTLHRKLRKVGGPEVTFVAGDDNLSEELAHFAANFEFLNSYKIRQGVTPVNEAFNAGCACASFCDPSRCLCLSKEEETNNLMVPYCRANDDKRLLVLTQDFLKRKAMIYECSSRCECDERCWNRVVQNGRKVRLEIFNTGNRGFGLRSHDMIRAGQFIDCYLGEVITKEMADAREDIATSQNGSSYLFSLDFLISEDETKYVVDGHKYGGPTRFMNHSCNPNCRMFPVSRNHADEYLYDLAFFALKDVPPMTELTFDYNPGFEASKTVDPNAVKCLCEEENCRGQLWPNQRKAKVMI